MKRIIYYLHSLWRILRKKKKLTPREQILALAKSEGFDSVHKVPERYRGKKKYKKVPRIYK